MAKNDSKEQRIKDLKQILKGQLRALQSTKERVDALSEDVPENKRKTTLRRLEDREADVRKTQEILERYLEPPPPPPQPRRRSVKKTGTKSLAKKSGSKSKGKSAGTG